MCAKKRKRIRKMNSATKSGRRVFRAPINQADGTAKGDVQWRYVTASGPESLFNDEQKGKASTQVEVKLPFGLPGLPTLPLTVYDDDGNQCVVELTYVRHPLNLVTHALEKGLKIKGDIRTLDMDGDSWGRITYTRAKVTLPYYCRIKPEAKVIGQSVSPIDVVSRKLLERVCVVLNKVIGVYVLHTNRYDLRELAPSDFLSYSAKHLLDGEKHNPTHVFYLNTLHVNSPEVVLPQATLDSISKVLGTPEALNLVYRLLFRARWSLELGNRRASVIDSVTGLEITLSAFVKERALRKGISEDRIKALLIDIGLSDNLKVLLRLVLSDREVSSLDDKLVERCSGTIRTRNEIVHEGLSDVDPTEVKKALDDITQFVQFLDKL